MTVLRLDAIPGYVVHELVETTRATGTYQASRAADGWPVIIEILTDPNLPPAAIERFRAVTAAVAAITHPVIPPIREVGEADGQQYVVSNAVDGQPLTIALSEQSPLPVDEALAVSTELADALDTLARAGVCHGAVGPSTVWINDRTRAPSAAHVSLRGHGVTQPTIDDLSGMGHLPPPADLYYAAPEQLRGDPVSARTDQYALACATLHCLTGLPPFAGPTVDELVRAHLYLAPDDLQVHAGELSARVVAGLRRALAKDPAERFASCLAFAEAIGGGTGRAWRWMVDGTDAATTDEHHEIDITDDTGPAGEGGAGSSGDGHAAWPTAGPQPPELTGRTLKEVDWLPDSATSTGPQRPVRSGRQAATAAAGPDRVRRWRAAHLRWTVFVVVLILAVVVAVQTGRRLIAVPAPGAAGAAIVERGDAAPEIQATWREHVGDQPLTRLAASGDEVIAVAGDRVLSLDQATARERWSSALPGAVRGMSTLGDTIIVRADRGFVGLDRTSGAIRWRSTDTALPDLDAVVTGRGRMFGVADTAGATTVLAVDPRTGDVGWTIDDPAGGGGAAGTAIAFDGSDRGGRTLYVLRGGTMTAFDTTTRSVRWQRLLPAARPHTLTALAGALLVITEDGRLCRYGAADGRPVWSDCASLEHPEADPSIVSVRGSRIIVGSTREVVSIDFTSGTARWRITSDRELQPIIATNPTATYIAAPDGTIEAVAQHSGASLWESAPFGDVAAMTATDDAIFLSTADGRLTRLEAPTAAGSG